MTKPDKLSSVAMEEVSHGAAEYANDPSFEIAWAVKVIIAFIAFMSD